MTTRDELTPERFRRLLEEGTATAPPAPSTATELAAGRSRLRRRRLAEVVAAAAAVVAVTGSVALATGGSPDQDSVDPVAPRPATDAPSGSPEPGAPLTREQLTDLCAAELPPGYFDGAERAVVAQATDLDTLLALESADGRYWASCQVPRADPDGLPQVQAYDSQGQADGGWEYSYGPGCSPATSACLYYALSAVDRVSPEVRSVRVELVDGTTRTSPVVDGYVVVDLLERLPAGARVEGSGRLDLTQPVHQVTYLDGQDRPLAAEVLDGTGAGPSGSGVAGLPRLSAYPSMRGRL